MESLVDLHNLGIHSSCRTCLENLNGAHHDIFATAGLQMKLSICTSLLVEPGDKYPTSLCEPCHTKINDFYDFKEKCLSSMQRYQEYMNANQIPNTLELSVDPIQQTHFIKLNKPKNEYEEEDYDKCSQIVDDQLKVKCKYKYSSEESEDDQAILTSDDECFNPSTDASDTEDFSDDLKPVRNRNINSSQTAKNFECEICKKCFRKAENLQRHFLIHNGIKPFGCQLCDASYVRRDRLKDHIKKKHEENPKEKFSCTEPGCEKTLCSKESLRQHIKNIHCVDNKTKTEYKCTEPGCGRTMGSKEIFRQHIRNVHSVGNHKTEKQYICEECGKVLVSLSNLKNHLYQHNGQQLPHECLQCKKRFTTTSKLKIHMNRHAGIRKFICLHCGSKKTTQSELKKHINCCHTQEKTYPCPFCDHVFNISGSLNRHKRIVHQGIKNYPCSFCGKSFGKAETRRHHEMIHTGEKPHECNLCDRKFIHSSTLKRHKKVHMKVPHKS